MIVLSAEHRYRVLPPQGRMEWRGPSAGQPKDMFGNENGARFVLRGRTPDRKLRWTGHFLDREDADAFLHAVVRWKICGAAVPRELWSLPRPDWHPDLGEFLDYEFATLVFYSTPATTSFNWPSDWNSANNFVDTIGAGASGATSANNSDEAPGGGAGAWNRKNNVSATPGASQTCQVGTGGVGVGAATSGNSGTDTYVGSSLGAATVGSKAGNGGVYSGTSGGTGGIGSSGVGDSSNNGGRGGNLTSVNIGGATGGGGAGGLNGAGNAGADATLPSLGFITNGGSGDAGSGGTGGSNSAGGNGAEYDASHGSGGGSSGVSGTNNVAGYVAGNYGAASGGVFISGSGGTSAAGASGLIVLRYTPQPSSIFTLAFIH